MTRLVRLVCLLVVCMALAGCEDERYSMPVIKLRYDTPVQRRASLSLLRRAWADRPRDINAEANLYERAVLNRAALFGRKVRETETYPAACDFWMACVKDHISRYDEDAHRFRF